MRTETARQQARKPTARRAPPPRDAIALLKQDHEKVLKMFKEFESLAQKDGRSEGAREELAKKICDELTVHTALEEEIFYPALRAAIDEELMMDEAVVEHDSAKKLIEEIRGMQAGDERYDATVVVLGEYIKHHVDEEHKEMFPQAKKVKKDLDLKALGEQMLARKLELSGADEDGE